MASAANKAYTAFLTSGSSVSFRMLRPSSSVFVASGLKFSAPINCAITASASENSKRL